MNHLKQLFINGNLHVLGKILGKLNGKLTIGNKTYDGSSDITV